MDIEVGRKIYFAGIVVSILAYLFYISFLYESLHRLPPFWSSFIVMLLVLAMMGFMAYVVHDPERFERVQIPWAGTLAVYFAVKLYWTYQYMKGISILPPIGMSLGLVGSILLLFKGREVARAIGLVLIGSAWVLGIMLNPFRISSDFSSIPIPGTYCAVAVPMPIENMMGIATGISIFTALAGLFYPPVGLRRIRGRLTALSPGIISAGLIYYLYDFILKASKYPNNASCELHYNIEKLLAWKLGLITNVFIGAALLILLIGSIVSTISILTKSST